MDNFTNHARIGKHDIPVVRSKLRAWLVLEELRTQILDAAEHRDRDKFVSSMYSYVSAALSIPVEELSQCFWAEVTRAYRIINDINIPNPNLPLIKDRPSKKKPSLITKTEGWEYPGRMWYFWLHVFSKNYGWSIEYIADLDIDVAFSLLQEIRLDEQLLREWEWGLSEVAFSYDANTKKTKFVPLKRPDWMTVIAEVKDLPNVKMKKSELPVGIVLRWDDGKIDLPQ